MSNLQVLKKRLNSVCATKEMAEAMKTVATVKYSRAGKAYSEYEKYSEACGSALELLGGAFLSRQTDEVKPRNCLVLLTSNRGFCGGFNGNVLRFFASELEAESEPPLLIVCGKKGRKYCTDRSLEAEFLEMEDIPSYAFAKDLTEKLFELYSSGEVSGIYFISQHFKNIMTQLPARTKILPQEQSEGNALSDETLFLPDRETVGAKLALTCLAGTVYRILLAHASGAQAATIVAMRSASDNAGESQVKLETMINRIRQAEVTNSVIETSSAAQGLES